jgi:hypothetical protein
MHHSSLTMHFFLTLCSTGSHGTCAFSQLRYHVRLYKNDTAFKSCLRQRRTTRLARTTTHQQKSNNRWHWEAVEPRINQQLRWIFFETITELNDFLNGNQWNWCFSYEVASTTFFNAYLMASERRFIDESSWDGSWIIFCENWKVQKRAEKSN